MSEIEKLKEDYKDDIIAVSEERRKYRMITNSDGTVSFVDATEYQQRGTNYGAGDVNKTNIAINLINKNLSDILHEELEFNGLNLCTDIHSAISNSSAKEISFFKRGKTLNMTINIELKANVNQYATLLRLPEKFKPKINQLFASGGTTYSINSATGAITPQQKIVSGAWIQISIEYQL